MIGGGSRRPLLLDAFSWLFRRPPRNRRERITYFLLSLRYPSWFSTRRKTFYDWALPLLVYAIIFLFFSGLFATEEGAQVRADVAKLSAVHSHRQP